MVNTIALHAINEGSIPSNVKLNTRIVKWYNANLVNLYFWFKSECRYIHYIFLSHSVKETRLLLVQYIFVRFKLTQFKFILIHNYIKIKNFDSTLGGITLEARVNDF